MSYAADIPVWAAIAIAVFLLAGAGLTLIGSIGMLRFGSFYERIHAPTLGASWGTAGIVMASMLLFTILEDRPVLYELLIGVFIVTTTPVTFMLLGRAAIYRDRANNNPDVPPSRVLEVGRRRKKSAPRKTSGS